jgi:cobalt-zinc-cadmium efflux system protein
MSAMSSASTHDHAATGTRALAAAFALNVGITVIEAVAGILTGSLALLGDALHNLSDVASLALAWGAARLAARAPTPERTFGLLRAEPLVAFVNALVLLPLAGWLVYAGVQRLGVPSTAGPLVMVLGGVALVVNAVSALVLKPHAGGDLGTRSALLHLATDAGASAAVVLGGALMWLGISSVDGVLSVGLGLFTLKAAYGLLREAAHALAEGAPEGASAEEVATTLGTVEGVVGVHHVHVWSVSSRLRAATAHVVVSRLSLEAAEPLLRALRERLDASFAISHATFELETVPCEETGVLSDPRAYRRGTA